jgi:hypothetical protein
MSLEQLTLIVGSLAVMPFWGLMILRPRWPQTHRICSSRWIVLPPIVCYSLILALALFNGQLAATVQVSIVEPQGIAQLLGIPAIGVAAWLHLLTFDLFVGRWVYLDSRSRTVSTWLVSLLLLLVLAVGPLGWGLYLLLTRRAAV